MGKGHQGMLVNIRGRLDAGPRISTPDSDLFGVLRQYSIVLQNV